jgi:hypothetical protein
MRFYFHPEAEAELDKAVEYYEQRQQGLGLEFVEEVYATITRKKAEGQTCLLSFNRKKGMPNKKIQRTADSRR